MSIGHRLKLQKFFNFLCSHLPVKQNIETKFPILQINQIKGGGGGYASKQNSLFQTDI